MKVTLNAPKDKDGKPDLTNLEKYDGKTVAWYRYYEGNLTKMVADKNIQDVIIMNNLEAIGGKRCDMIMAMFP